jgi:hypothetical protein
VVMVSKDSSVDELNGIIVGACIGAIVRQFQYQNRHEPYQFNRGYIQFYVAHPNGKTSKTNWVCNMNVPEGTNHTIPLSSTHRATQRDFHNCMRLHEMARRMQQ